MSGDQEPWVYRGGVQGELQVCIPGNAEHESLWFIGL
jgi:hypothetical protein